MRSSSRFAPREKDRQESGFTLVELLVVVGLIGLLATALAATIIVFLRSDGSVVSRLTNSQDLSNIENYLPGDVASAAVIEDGTTVPFGGQLTDANCLGIAGGNAILRLGWDQRWRDGSDSEFEVVYAYDAAAGEITRHECINSNSSSVVVARRFNATPAPSVAVHIETPPSDLLGTVELVLHYDDDVRRLAASSRNYVN